MSICASKPDKAHGAHRHSPASVLYRMLRNPVTGGQRPGDEAALQHLHARRVVECYHTYRSGSIENYKLAQRTPQDVYRLSARIAGVAGGGTPDTLALACAIVAHVVPELDADLAAATDAAADEYDGYARSGEQRQWTRDEIERHVQDYHYVRTAGRRLFAKPEGGSLADPEEAA